MLKGLTELNAQLLHLVLATCHLGQKTVFQKAQIPFVLKVTNLPKTVMIKTSSCNFGERRKGGI